MNKNIKNKLRTTFNEAAENRIIKKEKSYHFGKLRCRIPTCKNVKKALKLQDVCKIYQYKPHTNRCAHKFGSTFYSGVKGTKKSI